MHFLNLMQLCFSIFAWKSNGYVLLAANLDDFRSIAKQFVPEKLAEQLVEMSADPKKPNLRNENSEEYYLDTNEKSVEVIEIQPDNVHYKQRDEEVTKQDSEAQLRGDEHKYIDAVKQRNVQVKKFNAVVKKRDDEARERDDEVRKSSSVIKEMPNINMDDLVEKVKERLERDYKLKLSNSDNMRGTKYASDEQNSKTANKYSGSSVVSKYDNPKPVKNRESTQHIVTPRFKKESVYRITTQKYEGETWNPNRVRTSEMPEPRNTQKEYENGEKDVNYDEADYTQVTDQQQTQLLDAVDMLKSKDSYEDYVTPKKNRNIYDSKETSKNPIRNIAKPRYEKVQKISQIQMEQLSEVPKQMIKAKESDYEYEDTTPGEIKARTENMMFDDKEIHFVEETINDTSKNKDKVVNKMPKLVTMIPTREHFKMSSPNYYAKLPIIAEKYDFNEPIPERDREREDLRSIAVNPPASVNRKIKLS